MNTHNTPGLGSNGKVHHGQEGYMYTGNSLALNQESGCRLAEGPRSVKTVCYRDEDNRQVPSPIILNP